MKNTYLIQRLEKPFNPPEGHILHGKDNPFAFGGGLINGGLSDKAMDLLRPIFSFSYMGAAEFEFGAVPKALNEMLRNHSGLVKAETRIPNSKLSLKNWERNLYKPLPKEGEVVIFILCQKDHLDEVKKLIYNLVVNEDQIRLKEGSGLRRSLFDRTDGEKFNRKECGWLELDNGFFFFTDQEMFEKTCALFLD